MVSRWTESSAEIIKLIVMAAAIRAKRCLDPASTGYSTATPWLYASLGRANT
jgi:hypothetical protein